MLSKKNSTSTTPQALVSPGLRKKRAHSGYNFSSGGGWLETAARPGRAPKQRLLPVPLLRWTTTWSLDKRWLRRRQRPARVVEVVCSASIGRGSTSNTPVVVFPNLEWQGRRHEHERRRLLGDCGRRRRVRPRRLCSIFFLLIVGALDFLCTRSRFGLYTHLIVLIWYCILFGPDLNRDCLDLVVYSSCTSVTFWKISWFMFVL